MGKSSEHRIEKPVSALEPVYQTGPKTPEGKARASLNALKHGLYARDRNSLKLRSRRVRRLALKVRDALPWIQDGDMPVVRSWAELEIIGAAMFTLLEAGGVTSGKLDKSGDVIPRRLLGEYSRLKALQLQYSRELGMTPAARASLRVDALRGDDLATEMAAARQAAARGER